MDKLNSFGLLLLNSINRNNGENKRSFINYVNKYKDDKEKINNSNLEDMTSYLANYDNKREQNNSIYDEYLQKRFHLYNQWRDNKTNTNLIKLLYFNKPVLEEVPDVYTKTRFKSLLK